jgi:PAS domain S-box-containing protein
VSQQPRGALVTTVARLLSFLMGVVSLLIIWEDRRTWPWQAVAVLGAYAVFAVTVALWTRRRGQSFTLKVVHDVVDALTVGLGAWFSGGLKSPVWLLLYPHVVAVSVRAGLRHALVMGVLDAAIVWILSGLDEGQPLGRLHALSMIFCAFMGGLTSSALKGARERLAATNEELSAANSRLSATVGAHEEARVEQDRALALLQDSEERYRRLLERIQDGVVIIQEGRIAYANATFAEMAGSTPNTLLGIGFEELVPAEDRLELQERYRRWDENQQVSGLLETRLQRRDGEERLVSLRAGSVEYQGRRSIIATVRDITRERRMEQDVKAHAARLAAVNEIANAVNLSLTIDDIFGVAAEEARRLVPFDRLTIALVDEDDRDVEIVAVGNPTLRRHASFPRQDIQWAMRRAGTWMAGDQPAPPHAEELLAEKGVRSLATLPLMSKDRVIGSLNLGRLRALPFAAFDLAVLDPVARHIAIALDNARLIEAVRRRSQEFESLLDIGRGVTERLQLDQLLPMVTRSVNRVMGTRHCILLLRQGDVLGVAAQEGLEPEVVSSLAEVQLGQSLSGWVAQEGRSLALTDMRADPRLEFTGLVEKFGYRSYLCVPLRRGTEILGTLEVVTKQPRRFSEDEQELMLAFGAQAAVAIENARLFSQARAHLAEVTEANRQLAEVNRQLGDLDRMRQEYLRNVSHEFRTPLTVIKGYAEFLHDSGSPGEAVLRDVTRIVVESCDRVIDMVDTLLEVSRVEQGAAERTLQIQRVDVDDLVRTAAEPIRHAIAKKSIALALEVEPRLVVEGDHGLLTQVVRKLVDNAVKYSSPSGRVTVRARAVDGHLDLEVEDAGIGIAPEHQEHIFEKFYMVDGGLTRRVGGTGVGLYLVREIVRLHRGTVDVRSSPGRGALLHVRLPLEFAPAPGGGSRAGQDAGARV